jgi:nucleotide-binding universal stress UspA family protein
VIPSRLRESEETDALVRARQKLDEHVASLKARLPEGVDAFASVVVGTPFVEIVRRARDARADLVVLGRFGEQTFVDALIGSTAERVFRKADVPVLIVNREATSKYRRAVVAVDMSDTSRAATEMALRILDAHAAEVRVVYADDGRAWDVTTNIVKFLEPYEGAGVRWEVVDRRGEPRAVILGEIAATRPDLLVLGTHGRSMLTQQLVGSVAEAVVRLVACDVLVARPLHHQFQLP